MSIAATLRDIQERAPRTADATINQGAVPLSEDDALFWSRVDRVCGPEYVGRELPQIHEKLNKLVTLEQRRGMLGHWTYDGNRLIACLQLRSGVSLRIARAIQLQKYGRTYV